jgi:hypothetical protein
MDVATLQTLRQSALSGYKAFIACMICRNASSRLVAEFLDHLEGVIGSARPVEALAIPRLPLSLPVSLPASLELVTPVFRGPGIVAEVKVGAIVFYDANLVETIAKASRQEIDTIRPIMVAIQTMLRQQARSCCEEQILKRVWKRNPVRRGMRVRHQWRSAKPQRW